MKRTRTLKTSTALLLSVPATRKAEAPTHKQQATI